MKWPKLVRRLRGAAAMRLGRISTTRPLSADFGFSRGTPIDRYYIEQFLQAHSADIRGDTLEVGDDSYSRRFGRDRIGRQDVLHVDPIRRRDHRWRPRDVRDTAGTDVRLHHPDLNASAHHGCRSSRSPSQGSAETGRHLVRHRSWRFLGRPERVGRTLVLVHDGERVRIMLRTHLVRTMCARRRTEICLLRPHSFMVRLSRTLGRCALILLMPRTRCSSRGARAPRQPNGWSGSKLKKRGRDTDAAFSSRCSDRASRLSLS